MSQAIIDAAAGFDALPDMARGRTIPAFSLEGALNQVPDAHGFVQSVNFSVGSSR